MKFIELTMQEGDKVLVRVDAIVYMKVSGFGAWVALAGGQSLIVEESTDKVMESILYAVAGVTEQ